MTAAIYTNIDREGVTLDQLDSACSEASSALNGCLLILRVFAENGDEDTTDLCNVLTVMLKHVDSYIGDVRPYTWPMISETASLPDVATAHPGAVEGSLPSNPPRKNRGRS